MGAPGRAFSAFTDRLRHRQVQRRFFFADRGGRGQARGINDCRSFHTGSGRAEKYDVHGNGRIEAIGRTAQGKNVRVEREFYRGESTTGDGRRAVAISTRQGSAGGRLG